MAATVTANVQNAEMVQELSEAKANSVVLAREVSKLIRKVEEMRQESDKLGKEVISTKTTL